MKRLLSLVLVAVMLVCAVPMAAIVALADGAGGEVTYISKYADTSANFTSGYNEVVRNEAGLEKDAYYEQALDPSWFGIDQGIGAWKAGAYLLSDMSFSPFTRILYMINDGKHTVAETDPNKGSAQVGDALDNWHDMQWASTEELYLNRLDIYMNLWENDNNGANGGLSIWDNKTPLYYYSENGSAGKTGGLHNGLSGSNLHLSAFVYTVERDCWANFAISNYADQSGSGHGFAILVNGEMVWPVLGGDVTNTAIYYKTSKTDTATNINAALATANGTELKEGDEVAFAVANPGMPVFFCPEIIEYDASVVTISRSDLYGSNSGAAEVAPGSEYTIPKYEGNLIFMGWDANNDGIADYEDEATFTVPNVPAVRLTALVVAPSRFWDYKPTVDEQNNVTFHGDWTIGRYETETGIYDLFGATNGQHLYVSTGMWGNTGGGFYLNDGKIAFSGCTPDGTWVNQIQYTAPYNGTVSITYDQLIARREVNNSEANNIAYNFAIFKNGEKIWPTDSEWFSYVSEQVYSGNVADNDLLALGVLGEDFAVVTDIALGDTLEFRTQQGNAQSWMFYCKPSIAYTELAETPIVTGTGVTVGADSIGLNIFAQLTAARENSTMGMLYWTAPNANGEFLPSEADELAAPVLENGTYQFTYKDIAAKEMADVLYVMPYSMVDVNSPIYYGKVVEVSIVKYAEAAFQKANAATKAYLAALLNYGAEAQNFFDYNRDNLANAFLTDAEKQYDVSDAASVYAQTGDGAKIKSVSLICGNELGFKFMVDGVAGATKYELEFADNAEFTDSTKVDMVAAEVGPEYKAIVNIKNTEMAKTFYVRVVIDDAAGATLTYSVESFFYRISDTTDDSFYYLVASLVNLGRVTAELVNA